MMNKRQKGILIGSLVAIIIVATLVPTFIFISNNKQIPNDSSFTIFTEKNNIDQVTAEQFLLITNAKQKISLVSLLEYYSIEVNNSAIFIFQAENYLKVLEEDISDDYFVKGDKSGFSIIQLNKKYQNLVGICIDISNLSVDIPTATFEAMNMDDWETQGEKNKFNLRSNYEKIVYIILDGFGWHLWENLTSENIISYNWIPMINQPTLTVFPSITNVAIASLVTGYFPSETGIQVRQNHQLQVPTVFEIASDNGFITEYIEGSVGYLNIQADFEHWLTDDDGDGDTDDEIFEETINSLNESRSDYLFVHFHGIDDIGHLYGIYASEWYEKVNYTFTILEEIIAYIPESSLIVLTADHGMHLATEGDRLGIHGECRFEDMLTPIIMIEK